MKKPATIIAPAAIVAGVAAAAAYALVSRQPRRRCYSDRIVLITGGSRGLGLALAARFGREGAKLVLAARDHDELILSEAKNPRISSVAVPLFTVVKS